MKRKVDWVGLVMALALAGLAVLGEKGKHVPAKRRAYRLPNTLGSMSTILGCKPRGSVYHERERDTILVYASEVSPTPALLRKAEVVYV